MRRYDLESLGTGVVATVLVAVVTGMAVSAHVERHYKREAERDKRQLSIAVGTMTDGQVDRWLRDCDRAGVPVGPGRTLTK